MASTISCDEANFPVPVNRCESNVLSAIRSISTPCNNLKKQDLVAFLHDLLFPLLARQDLLIQRQRYPRLELIKLCQQRADILPLGTLYWLIIELDLHVALRIQDNRGRGVTPGYATGWFYHRTGVIHRLGFQYR
ncbi:hypothetical protein D3C81_1780920 [compost metagenome]